jgi:hypothetical protein
MKPRQLKKLTKKAALLIEKGSEVGLPLSRYSTQIVFDPHGNEFDSDLCPSALIRPGTIGYGDEFGYEEREWMDNDAYSCLHEFILYDCCKWVMPPDTGDPDIDIQISEQPVWPKNLKITPAFVFRYARMLILKEKLKLAHTIEQAFLAGYQADRAEKDNLPQLARFMYQQSKGSCQSIVGRKQYIASFEAGFHYADCEPANEASATELASFLATESVVKRVK